MISKDDVLSIGVIRRTHYKDLPPFVFVLRDGLLVPFRSEDISELIGEEGFVLRSDLQTDGDELCWQDLVGYTIMVKNAKFGTITAIDDSTMNVFAELEDGRLVPLHEDLICEIDSDNRYIHMQFPFEV